jgi:hypothetical protein
MIMGCIEEEEDGMACIEFEEGTALYDGEERHPADVDDMILDEEDSVKTPQTRSDSTYEAGTSSTMGCNQ